jgi:MOSC domain-containing protein YiiM
MAHVSNLFLAMEHRKPMRAVDRAIALADRGFEGCIHARQRSKRQLLLVDSETLAEFRLAPGIVRENITTAGLNMAELKPGQRLVIGSAVLEVTIPCEPCFQMDEIRKGLREAIKNRRGVLCRVIEGGQIACGDAIEMSGAATASPSIGGAL